MALIDVAMMGHDGPRNAWPKPSLTEHHLPLTALLLILILLLMIDLLLLPPATLPTVPLFDCLLGQIQSLLGPALHCHCGGAITLGFPL